MGVPKKLTEKQIKFAHLIVSNEGRMKGVECAKEAGYGKACRTRACELQNPKKYPLVVKYISELRAENYKDHKILVNKILIDFSHLLEDTKKKLDEDFKKGNHKRVVTTINKCKEVFTMVGLNNSPIIVYLSEETRPYKTNHYKIGKTENCLASRSTGRTDNPFGLNYIASFTYIPSNGFNLEKTLHNFFRNFSTYNEKYNTSASEWFSVKNKNTMLKNFKKVGFHLLNKNNLFHKYDYYGKKGYFKWTNTISLKI